MRTDHLSCPLMGKKGAQRLALEYSSHLYETGNRKYVFLIITETDLFA